ncbi:uncharacterized protein LOC135833235 [Planococcus citri]|uniref:uncharacterized protein LOC135833235 n=1 Tax=Planococcus citri TaxID=170843 RepID=UPI0031F9040E
MELDSQEECVKKLETKLSELREQRIKVDEANEILRKKLQTLTKHLDDLDLKYAKEKDEAEADKKETKSESTTNSDSDPKETNQVDAVAPDEPEKCLVPEPETNNDDAIDGSNNTEKNSKD